MSFYVSVNNLVCRFLVGGGGEGMRVCGKRTRVIRGVLRKSDREGKPGRGGGVGLAVHRRGECLCVF